MSVNSLCMFVCELCLDFFKSSYIMLSDCGDILDISQLTLNGAVTKRYSVKQVFLKSMKNHSKIPGKEFIF